MINFYSADEKNQFVSRETMKKVFIGNTLKPNTYIISINDNRSDMFSMLESFLECGVDQLMILPLIFADDDKGIDNTVCADIKSFVELGFEKNANILVHCFAGISRSGAVAKWINDYYTMGNSFLECYGNYNRSVYNSLNAYVGCDLASYYSQMAHQYEVKG